MIIQEPDVSPLQLQGPKLGEIAAKLFGESIRVKILWASLTLIWYPTNCSL